MNIKTQDRQTKSKAKNAAGGASTPALYVCGLNHERADLGARERYALDADACRAALERIRDEGLGGEGLVLSTCNRTEVYVFASEGEKRAERLESFFHSLDRSGGKAEAPPLYSYRGLEAVRHLFAVTSGLNSMILGENEIKGQVRQAFEMSEGTGMAGSNLHHLINRAHRCSKRIRSETKLNAGTLCFGRAAVMRAEETLGALEGKKCVVVGAGKIGRAAAIALNEKRPGSLHIINRTIERAQEVAEGLAAEVAPISEMPRVLREADLVIGAAFAPNFLVTRKMFEQVRAQAPSRRPVCLIDAAVPRILEASIGEIEGVSRFDLGDLEGVIEENRKRRLEAAREAWRLVEKEVETFHVKLRVSGLAPAIERLKRRFEQIEAEASEESDGEYPDDLQEKHRAQQRRLRQRLLHEAIGELKRQQADGSGDAAQKRSS